MQRDQSEPLGRALSRLATSALKGHPKAAAAKKSRKNRPNASGSVAGAGPGSELAAACEPVVKLYYRERAAAEDVLHVDSAVLQIGDVKYKKVTDDSVIRTVSYDLQADAYAQTEFSRSVLYLYCAPYALELDYRQNLTQRKLTGYKADLICLQEDDRNVFTDGLVPALQALGLEGVLRIKQQEGLATFYRKDQIHSP
ncbi:hypothetical protein GH733_018968 [Mirounga leonina]|nr:hypothetical protein GH733_018968 [Mirounga leonina]